MQTGALLIAISRPRPMPAAGSFVDAPDVQPMDAEDAATAAYERFAGRGLDGFVEFIEQNAAAAAPGRAGRRAFVSRLGEACAFIRMKDVRHPFRFLRQMAGQPPLRFGVSGFHPDMVDDKNPARHYMAFVVVGYWLPWLLALLVLYAWEVAGFVRYGGVWSRNDVRSGKAGLRHGRCVQREGPNVLGDLVRRDLGI